MDRAPDLFTMVRNADPDTSHKAASSVAPHAGTGRFMVLVTHLGNPAGLTDFELAEKLGGQQNSLGKRRTELRDAGFIEDSGIRRPAPSGSSAIVWRITPLGQQVSRSLCSA